jgi:hypothetical protein
MTLQAELTKEPDKGGQEWPCLLAFAGGRFGVSIGAVLLRRSHDGVAMLETHFPGGGEVIVGERGPTMLSRAGPADADDRAEDLGPAMPMVVRTGPAGCLLLRHVGVVFNLRTTETIQEPRRDKNHAFKKPPSAPQDGAEYAADPPTPRSGGRLDSLCVDNLRPKHAGRGCPGRSRGHVPAWRSGRGYGRRERSEHPQNREDSEKLLPSPLSHDILLC